MYLSKKHKLAFIAVPRTASLSVQSALTESAFSDETDIVTELSDPKNMDSVVEYHMTLANLTGKGLISEEEFSQYTKIGFVREPLSRWVSSVFLARHIGKLPDHIDPVDQMITLLRSPTAAALFKKDTADGFNIFHYHRYFFKGGQQVVTAYHWQDAEAVITELIQEKCGADTQVSFPNIQINPNGVPDQFKQPISDWLPSDCCDKLSAYLADDIAFYNSVERRNG